MATIIRTDSLTLSASTPTLSSKTLLNSNATQAKQAKPAPVAQRIDIEPLYTALKGIIGDTNWAVYKETISAFVLGQLNQEELGHRIDHFISVDPSREHLHNQFIAAIYGNAARDPPEPGVASWVSASDKPAAVAKTSAGDGAEQRLKREIMQLPARERRRLKAMVDEPYDLFAKTMMDYYLAKQIKPPDTGSASAASFNKTNWDLEIRKRYAQPLFQETFEFPDAATIEARLVPICYEEGLPSGASTQCAAFLNVACEAYIKEVLTTYLSRVATNAPDFPVRTASFRRVLDAEQARHSRGDLAKTATGLLPAEVAEQGRRRPFGRADLRVAMALGDPYLGQVPLVAAQVIHGGWEDGELDGDPMSLDDPAAPATAAPAIGAAVVANGPTPTDGPAATVAAGAAGAPSMLRSLSSKAAVPTPPAPATVAAVVQPLVNGSARAAAAAEAMRPPDEEGWGAWAGAAPTDAAALDGALDELLAIAD